MFTLLSAALPLNRPTAYLFLNIAFLLALIPGFIILSVMGIIASGVEYPGHQLHQIVIMDAHSNPLASLGSGGLAQ